MAVEAGDKVWVLVAPCGWSRMVPRSTPTQRRRQIIVEHCEDHGCRNPYADE